MGMECQWDTSLLGWAIVVEVMKGLANMKIVGEENSLISDCGKHMHNSDLPLGDSLCPDFTNSINRPDVLLVDTYGPRGNQNEVTVVNSLKH